MTNIVEFPDRRVIEQEAVEWLIRLDGDTPPSKEELRALKEWMSRSPAHTEEMQNLGAFWSNLVLTELNVPLANLSALSLANQQLNGATGDRAALQQPGRRRGFRMARRFSAVAACLLAVAVFLQQTQPGWLPGRDSKAANGEYTTAVGEQIAIPLVDGSVVHLNTNSRINVEYNEGYRNIRLLQGEAYFEVAKNQDKPFRVYAGQGRVQAVGTAFSVYLRGKDVDVLVTEGKVELAAQSPASPDAPLPDSAAAIPPVVSETTADTSGHSDPEYYLALPVEELGLLAAGQGATIRTVRENTPRKNQQAREVKLMDSDTLKRRDAWRKGLLLFTGDSLEEVVDEISRYTTVSIEIIDPRLKKIRIGGQFRVGDLSGMFDVLETNFGLHITRLDDNRIQISAAETIH
jgi:transmembrane sensor